MKKILFPVILLIIAVNVRAQDVQTQPDGNTFTSILLSGSTSSRYDIVFIGDGFRLADQALFNTKVDEAVAALQAMDPYGSRMCALNIWRVNVLSDEAGVDHPKDGIFKNTELDCRYGNPAVGEAERCVTSSSPAKCYAAAGHAPAYDAVFVLVNDVQWGGCAGGLVFSSISPGFAGIITHELGHKIGSLADEYTCYVCDGSDGMATYTGGEPASVNLTIQTNPSLIKWKSLIAAGTPIPTTVDNPPGVVGLFQGGGYYPLGIYRPQMNCHMKSTGSPFCAVCRNEMYRKLVVFCPWRVWPGKFYLYRKCFWKLPWCGLCPLIEDFRSTIILPEINIKEFTAEVVDGDQKVVAKSIVVNNQLQIDFEEKGGEGYFVVITPVSGKYTGQAINFSPKLLRNNQQVRLF